MNLRNGSTVWYSNGLSVTTYIENEILEKSENGVVVPLREAILQMQVVDQMESYAGRKNMSRYLTKTKLSPTLRVGLS